MTTEQQRIALLIEERRAMDGQPFAGREWSFAQWLQGVKDGMNPRDERQAPLL